MYLLVFACSIFADSIFKTSKNYYPRVFLEECQYVIKGKKIHNYITDYAEISSDEGNSDEEDSSRKEYSGKDFDEKNQFFSTHIIIIKSYLTIEKIIIQHIKSNYQIFLKILGQSGLFQG